MAMAELDVGGKALDGHPLNGEADPLDVGLYTSWVRLHRLFDKAKEA